MAERNVAIRLSAIVEPYKRAMAEAQASTKQFQDQAGVNFQQVGAKMQSVGRTMTTHVTLPLIGLGVGAARLSSDFNTAFGQMVGLAGIPAGEVDRLKEAVLDLAGETARSPQELAEALYFASSAGLDAAQSMDAVTIAARASQVGLGSTQDIVGLAASAIASYGSENINAAEATDILVSTIREGRAEPAELAGTLGRVLPIASQLGVSFDEVGGTVAYLSNVFGDTNRTVTATQGLLVKMVSPSQQGRDALREMGTSAEELQAAVDRDGLLGALELLKSAGFDTNAQALRALFDDIEGYQAATALLAADQGDLAATFAATADSTGSLQQALNAVDEDTQAAKQAWVDIQIALIQAGEIIMPIVADVAGGVSALAGVFGDLPGPVQVAVLGALAFVAAIGPILSIAGKVVMSIDLIVAAMVRLKAATLGHPILALATVAAAVGTALFFMGRNAKSAEDAIDDMSTAMTEAGDAGKGLVDTLMTDDWEFLIPLMDEAGVTVTEVAEAALAGGAAWEHMSGKLNEAAEATSRHGLVTDALKDGIDKLLPTAEAAVLQMEQRARVDDRAKESAEGATGANEDLSGSLDGVTTSAGMSDEALADLIETMLTAVGATFDYESASLSLADAHDNLVEKQLAAMMVAEDSTATDVEKAAAMREVRQAEIATAEQALKTAEAYAREQGAADGTVESAVLQREKLRELAFWYPELGEEVGAYIDRLNAVPGVISSTVELDTWWANEELNRLFTRLGQLNASVLGLSGGFDRAAYQAAGGTFNRAGGGPVRAGALYEVGEGNVAEMFVVGGRQFMIPGNDGAVIPGSQLVAESDRIPPGSTLTPVTPAGLPRSVTLIIEGRPFSAMLAEHDRELLGALNAGVRG